MKTILISFALFFLAGSVSAQMKSWTDENGIVHYESAGPGSSSSATVRDRLSRNYAGLSLDQTLYFFLRDRRAIVIERDQGIEVYRIERAKWPTRVVDLLAAFNGERMIGVIVKFPENEWDALVKMAGETYGPALKGDTASQVWQDSATSLVISKKGSSTTVMLGDVLNGDAFLKSMQVGAPKF